MFHDPDMPDPSEWDLLIAAFVSLSIGGMTLLLLNEGILRLVGAVMVSAFIPLTVILIVRRLGER